MPASDPTNESGPGPEAGPGAIRVRPASASDVEFALGLVERLVDFAVPPWRDADAIRTSSEALVRSALERPSEDAAVLIAEDSSGHRLGFLQVETAEDFFSGREQGYVANLAVAGFAEGRGVGRALTEAAEAWVRARGLGVLTLYVFADNGAARRFYERMGFREDSLMLVKLLQD